MPREVRLIRQITAQVGGWAGDGADWTQASPPVAAGAHEPSTKPIMALPLRRKDAQEIPVKGASGLVRVTGADSARRFNLKLFVAWARRDATSIVTDWRLLSGTQAREVGNGDDFDTSVAASLQDQDVAFHLTPVGGNLAEGSVVEIWAAEV